MSKRAQKLKKPSPDKILLAVATTTLMAAATLLLLVAFESLGWRMEHDTPLMHYVAFLMDKYDRVPYRDIFDMNMPGTYAFHYVIGKLFGYGDLGFRIADLGLLSVLLGTTFLFMSRFGRLVSVSSALLFGLLYLPKGQRMSLQRDYIGIIPVALALLCIPARTDSPVRLVRFVIVGLLFGTSFLIKPHLAIGLPVVFGTLVTFRWNSQMKSSLDLMKCGAICGISFCVPLLAAITWLVANSAFVPFIDLWVHYLPLYGALTGGIENIEGFDRFFYLIESTIKMRDHLGNPYGILFVAGVFGYYRIFTDPRQSKANEIFCMCIWICTCLYALYPILAGKFWSYHYMPLAYFCAISAGLCLSSWPAPIQFRVASLAREALPLLVFLTAVTIHLNVQRIALGALSELPPRPEWHAPYGGRVDAIASWLGNHLQPGDSVQPLDRMVKDGSYRPGVIHAMLISEARLATRFMYDFHFYHHISTPFIQELRKSFMRELREASPRFIIEVHKNALDPEIDSTLSFPELRTFLDRFYVVVFEGDSYLIRERSDNGQPSSMHP